MPAGQFQAGSTRILYDPGWTTAISLEWLHTDFWRLRGAVRRELGGRGQAIAIDTLGGPAVLRRYHRGGQVARISRDRYLFRGYSPSRGFREWRLLARLHADGLPVPRPLMASCERVGMTYRAGLMTGLIDGAEPLQQRVDDLSERDWQHLVGTLRRFFEAGVVHADLNAGNVLRGGDGCWYLIDFDRARLRGGRVDPTRMIRRLRRSLTKNGQPEVGARLARTFEVGP
jgi:3-deoxy-D-manno-octulosonic acid kinase